MTNKKLIIGISSGDINGIGLEVALKVLSDKRLLDWCTPVIYASTKVVSYHKNIAKIRDFSFHNTNSVQALNPQAVNVINCWMENVKITLGQCTADGGKYATFALEQATEDLRLGHLDALVTAPINKEAMKASGFEFPGHTEYLTNKFNAPENLMLLVNESLRVGLVTNHLPLGQVASSLNKELILKKIQLMDESLKMDFGIDRPAIALLGLNPHAGDGGVLGSEEKDLIMPAIEAAKKQGILVIGPYAADGFFGSGNYLNFDGILAMYHDQGLVPFKALSFGKGINFTAGLPIIRTSPDHGTGFDIAGKNMADPQSFREALYLAMDSARQRAAYKVMTKNPLKELIAVDNEGEASSNKRQGDKKSKKTQGKKERREKTPRSNKREEQPIKSSETQPLDTTKEETKKEVENNTAVPVSPPKKKEQNLSVEERLALAAQKKQQQKAVSVPETPVTVDVITEEELPLPTTEELRTETPTVAETPELIKQETETVKEVVSPPEALQTIEGNEEEGNAEAPTTPEE
ncbi:MAG: 4-hydroxythreonine-4-phosphate dehydrogenase PdxA [Aureispira sp.]